MHQFQKLSDDVRPISYPPGSSDSAASSNAPPFRIKYTVPPHVVVPDEMVMAWWDASLQVWVKEGVSDATFAPEERLLSFQTTKLHSIALVQSRQCDLPHEAWSLKPMGLSAARLTLQGPRFTFVMDISESSCILRSPGQPEFESLIGVSFANPQALFNALKKCGVNLCPVDSDAKMCSVRPKVDQLEQAVVKDICTLASAFTLASSKWNRSQNEESCLFRMVETDFDGHSSDVAQKDDDEVEAIDPSLWKTANYMVDRRDPELETAVEEPKLLAPIKCLLVNGGEEEYDSRPEPAAVTHAYLKGSLEGKCTADSLERIDGSSPSFLATIRSVFKNLRLVSFC